MQLRKKTVFKVHHLPPPAGGVLLLGEEEKANVLLISTFPSFQRRGGPSVS